MWYLHAPDRATPYDVTMKAINDLYKEGKFKRFGISNYQAYVAQSHSYSAPAYMFGLHMGSRRDCGYLQAQWVHIAHRIPGDLQCYSQASLRTGVVVDFLFKNLHVGGSSPSSSHVFASTESASMSTTLVRSFLLHLSDSVTLLL